MTGSDVRKKLKDTGISFTNIANEMGVSVQNLHSMLGAKNMTTGSLELIAKAINKPLYFFYEETLIAVNGEGRGVPYYDADATGGIVESFDPATQTPDFYVDFKPFNDCAAYLPIFGDSMYPMFSSGEIIAIKKMTNLDFVLWGEPYLVVTGAECDNMRTVKLVHPHEDADKIILRASNPNFKGDTVILKSAIVGLYLVKGKVNRRHM